MSTPTENDASERRPSRLKRLRRFRLSTLLIVVTLVGVWLAISFNRERLSIANITELKQRERIDVDIWKVVWTPDGQRVALVGWEKPVQILDGTTLWKMQTIGEGKAIIHFAFSPDDDTVAYCENGKRPCILDLSTGQTRVLDTGTGQSKLDFSPDGKSLVTARSGSACLWDVRTGKLLHDLEVGNTGGLRPRFSPDGRLVAIGKRNSTTHIFRADSGEELVVLPKRMSQEIAFHPTAPIIAVAYVDASIGLWDVRDGSLLHDVQTTAEEIYTLDWSPDGTLLVSAGLHGQINIWKGDDLTLLHTLPAPEWVISVRFRPDMRGLVVAGGAVQRTGKRFVQEFSVPSLSQRLVRGDW